MNDSFGSEGSEFDDGSDKEEITSSSQGEGKVSSSVQDNEGTSSLVETEIGNVMGLTDDAVRWLGERQEPITSENTTEYWKDRFDENIHFLYEKGPHLVNAYKEIVNDCPDLRRVQLRDEDTKKAYFCRCSFNTEDRQYRMEIALNFSNLETYIDPEREFFLRSIAIQLGARYEDVKNNKKLATTFSFLHEFGHAKDFIENYLKPKENREKKRPLAEVLNQAETEAREHRLRDGMTLPVPLHVKFGSSEDYKRYQKRFETFGIKPDMHGEIPKEKGKIVHSVAYREMSSEAIADTFARKYIMKHRNEYFLPFGVQSDNSGRIKTGGEIMMENEDIILAGIRDGNSLTIKKVAQTGVSAVPVGHMDTGFLDGQFALGESMRLVQDLEANSGFIQTSPVVSMRRKMLADGRTLFVANTASGAIYQVIRNPEIKPKQVPKTVEQMKQALGIKQGSEVILMKRDIPNQTESDVKLGQILKGRLRATPELHKVIAVDGEKSGNTSNIMEVGRTWRTWHVETFTSTYEIVPTE